MASRTSRCTPPPEVLRVGPAALNPGRVLLVNVGHPEDSTVLERVLGATLAEVLGTVMRDPAEKVNTLLIATDAAASPARLYASVRRCRRISACGRRRRRLASSRASEAVRCSQMTALRGMAHRCVDRRGRGGRGQRRRLFYGWGIPCADTCRLVPPCGSQSSAWPDHDEAGDDQSGDASSDACAAARRPTTGNYGSRSPRWGPGPRSSSLRRAEQCGSVSDVP